MGKRVLPWVVPVDHRPKERQYLVALLSAEAGGHPAPVTLAQAQRWWEEEMEPNDLVVTYSPEAGFGTAHRQEGDARYYRPSDPGRRRPRQRPQSVIDIRDPQGKEEVVARLRSLLAALEA